jgi:hypothetical protein
MVIGGVNSIHQGDKPIATPEMEVKYAVPKESKYWKV